MIGIGLKKVDQCIANTNSNEYIDHNYCNNRDDDELLLIIIILIVIRMLCVVLVSRRRGPITNSEEGASTPPALGRAALSQGTPAVWLSSVRVTCLSACLS